jgi:hypothetical protein
LGPQDITKVIEAGSHIRVVRAEGCLADPHRSLEQHSSAAKVPLLLPQPPEVVEVSGHIRVVRPIGLLVDVQGPLEQGAGSCEISLCL